MSALRPERLNLAVGHRCYVSCPGCYQLFGHHEPDLGAFEPVAARFAELGLRRLTLSGGDPLTLDGLFPFLNAVRTRGMEEIKLDTVGTGLLRERAGSHDDALAVDSARIGLLLETVNYIGIPLDGWSNQSSGVFRRGRPELYDETRALLHAFDQRAGAPSIVINTVLHRHNAESILRIRDEVVRHRSVACWNIFQYTPTDQVSLALNRYFALPEERFREAEAALAQRDPGGSHGAGVIAHFHTVAGRVGRYLLINSDGMAWLPDHRGRTVRLGPVFGQEAEVLERWSAVGQALLASPGAIRPAAPLEARPA
jgi:MoaA/NifB/PqqE/SkfB family radical SAM enzyme